MDRLSAGPKHSSDVENRRLDVVHVFEEGARHQEVHFVVCERQLLRNVCDPRFMHVPIFGELSLRDVDRDNSKILPSIYVPCEGTLAAAAEVDDERSRR
jgi:hypothetical protein